MLSLTLAFTLKLFARCSANGLLFGFSVVFKRYIKPPVLICFCEQSCACLSFFILTYCGY